MKICQLNRLLICQNSHVRTLVIVVMFNWCAFGMIKVDILQSLRSVNAMYPLQ